MASENVPEGMVELDACPDYFIDKQGNVYSKRLGKFLDRYYGRGSKHPEVCMYNPKTGKQTIQQIGKLVLETFGFPKPNNNQVIKYKNGDSEDLRLENLAWSPPPAFIKNLKELKYLKKKDIEKIKDLYLNKKWNKKDIAIEMIVHQDVISHILKGERRITTVDCDCLDYIDEDDLMEIEDD